MFTAAYQRHSWTAENAVRQTDWQKDQENGRETDKLTDRETGRWADRKGQANRETGRRGDGQTERYTGENKRKEDIKIDMLLDSLLIHRQFIHPVRGTTMLEQET